MKDSPPTAAGVPPRTVQDHDSSFGLRATIDRAPIGLAQFDAQGRFLLVNDRLCEILGQTRDAVLDRTFQELTFPEDLPHCLELTARLAAGDIPSYCVEKRFVRPDGSAVWTRITVSAVRGADGAIAFFIGAAEDISEQVAASALLRMTEERLRTALDASMIGTFRFDVRRNALEWADGMERVFGTSQNITLEQFFEAIHPDDRAHVLASYDRSVTEGVDFEEDFRVIWPDGTVHWLHDRGQIVLGTDGRPHYIDGAITDVSNHKRMEKVIRERDAQFRTLANAIPQLAWIADSEGNRTWFNDRWYDYTGYGLEDLQNLGWMRVHDPQLADGVLAHQRAAFRAGTEWEETVRLRGRDGVYRWFLSRAMPVRTTEGVIMQWVGTNTDITDRLQAEQQLREREVRYRRALNVENIGVIFFDQEHRITGVNDAFARMSGYTSAKLDGMVLWQDLILVDDRRLAEAREAEFAATGRTTPFEQEFIRPDGTNWWGLVAATRVSETEGVKYVLDVTARKQAEREREAVLRREQLARQEAERATALRQQVLGFVAHDLRNPLHTIVMSTSSLLELSLPDEQRSRLLDLIGRSAWNMDRLIGDLLDVSRIEAGTFAVRLEPVEIPQVLLEVIGAFQDRARARGITLRSEVSPRLPSVQADQQRLVQALSNLVGNAIKFTPSGGRVLLAARADRTHVAIVVRDTGCGIAAEHLQRVFDRFWQADRTAGGAGLGLAIVKGIVESHHGEIHVDSEPGRGTTFSIQLPRAPVRQRGERQRGTMSLPTG